MSGKDRIRWENGNWKGEGEPGEVTTAHVPWEGGLIGTQRGALSSPVAKAKRVLVLTVPRWLPVAFRAMFPYAHPVGA